MFIKKVKITFEGISEEYSAVIREIAERRLSERAGIAATENDEDYNIVFEMKTNTGDEYYRITPGTCGVCIEADTNSALLTGFGSFLRKSELWPERGMLPQLASEEHIFEQHYRGMYLASHNKNFYEMAPMEEIRTLIEDLALWGMNAVSVWFDMYQKYPLESPDTVKFTKRLWDILNEVHRIGLQTAMGGPANEAFPDSPEELRADWKPQGKYFAELIAHYHAEICPSKEGGIERILSDRRKFLELIKDFPLDYYFFFPYDQGGCTCEKCAPWGANGYLRTVRALKPLIQEYFPDIKFALSTWYFDHFTTGEWDAFKKEMEAGDYRKWLSYVEGFFDTGEHIPEFLKEGNGVAGIPMIQFSEISMYGAKPWGGFGANPITKKFSSVSEHSAGIFKGCRPYSEGIYEDINKVMALGQVSGVCRDGFEANYEYAKLEYSPDVAEDAVKLFNCLEESLLRVRMDDEAEVPGTISVRFGIYFIKHIDYARKLAESINDRLDEKTRKNWKWRIVYLRALIDYELYHNNWYMNRKVIEYMDELTEIYYAQEANYFVCPPTPDSLKRNGVNYLGRIVETSERTKADLGEQGKNG